VRTTPRRFGIGRLVSRLPILGEVRLDRRLGWVIPVFIVLMTGIVGYNAYATAHERGPALVVNIASRQRTLVERYTKDVMLVIDGFQADPDQSGAILHQTADALLDGGSVAAPQGNDDHVEIPAQRDWKVRRKLQQDRRLIEELTHTGDDLLAHGRGDPRYRAKVTRLRVLSAQLSSVSNDAVGEITRHTEASLSRLVRVEIALGLLGALAATIAKLDELKRLGVRLAIDDFGTGSSSLSYLRRFPVDILKVDKSFIDAVADNIEDSALAKAIIELGHTLRLQTVAEGVEASEQASQLRTLHCELGQGYYFAHPLDADQVAALLEHRQSAADQAASETPVTEPRHDPVA
jgi:hypothetical protein